MSFNRDFDAVDSMEERLEQLDKKVDERLRPYGIDSADVEREELVVDDTHELTTESAPSIVELQPNSVSEMKTWIGVDDESAPAVHLDDLPSRRPSIDELVPVMGSNTAEEDDPRDVVSTALSNHLYCDSRTCPGWGGVLDEAVEASEFILPLVPLKSIHINSGGTLDVGPDVSVLFADMISIENGGQLLYDGGLKIDSAFLDGKP